MNRAHPVLPPTSSLPRLRSSSPDDVSEEAIVSALRNLTDIYCPLPRPAAFRKPASSGPSRRQQQDDYLTAPVTTTTPPLSTVSSGTSTPLPVDSGYASGEEDEKEPDNNDDEHAIAALRADPYERQCAIRWLTSFIARAEELLLASDDDARQRLIDDASYILASFSSATDAEEDEDAGAIVREFRFQLGDTIQDQDQEQQEEGQSRHGDDNNNNYIEVRLTDGTPATGSDHTDVGLQSWGASIVVSDLMCAAPEKFGLTPGQLGHAAPRVVELGAGTGLVGITMAKLLPRLGMPRAEVVATDYHPAVLANLADNIAANFPLALPTPTTTTTSSSSDSQDLPPSPSPPAAVIQTCLLDWAAPVLDPPLDKPADVLIATDVVYAPEHAVWLRDCAGRLLACPGGVFWLVASVRPNGRFEGVTDTVESAFRDDGGSCPRVQMRQRQRQEGEDEEGGEKGKGEDGGTKTMVLRILGQERLEKRKGVGRGDEIGYKVFRIGWEAEAEAEEVL